MTADLTCQTKMGKIVGGTEVVPDIRGRALELDGGSGCVETP